jgi:hypothetical protein
MFGIVEGGAVALFKAPSGARTHLVVDVAGYFR